jgi:hypothetical protein
MRGPSTTNYPSTNVHLPYRLACIVFLITAEDLLLGSAGAFQIIGARNLDMAPRN